MSLKSFVININKNYAFIKSCKVTIPINARQRRQFFRRKLLISDDNVVLPHSKIMIPLSPISPPDNRNFLLHLIIQANLTLYAHIVDYITTKILVSNISDPLLHILQHQKLGHIVDICYKNCFLANIQAIFNSAVFLPKAQSFFNLYAGIALAPTDTDIPMETHLNNGIEVYRDKAAVREISELVA